jgi:hypothetical protein
MFLSGLAAFRRFPGKSSGGPIWGFRCGANFPHVLVVVLRLRSVSPFTTCRFQRAATPVLLLPLKRRPLRQRSPHPPRRPNDFTCGLYARPTDHRTGEGFTGHDSGPFFSRWRHATPSTVLRQYPYFGRREGRQDRPPVLHARAEFGTPRRPKCRPPESSCLAPSPPPLLRTSRWGDPSYVPPLKVAKFEQEVLYKHGLAQVGFSFPFALLSQLHRFF